MSQVMKHPTDEGKYQSTLDSYGHGKGNGKSRAAVYKHNKKISKPGSEVVEPSVEKEDFVKTEEPTSQNPTEFDDVSWLDEEPDSVKSTIPRAIRGIATGEQMTAAQRATQGQLVRWGYMGLDRGITHWGRGVTGNEDYVLERSMGDYDALEGATMHWMDSRGIGINLSPGIVLTTVIGAAYVPPVTNIVRNADPNRRGLFLYSVRRFLGSPLRWFRNRRNRRVQVPTVPVSNDAPVN